MVYKGVLTKMQTEFLEPIQYYLVFENDFLHINQLLDKPIAIKLIGSQCLSCNLDKPIYRQGFCKSCFFDKPFAGDWIMRPELSTAHLGKEDRDLDYEKKVQLQPHIVYLANSSTIKVGVTRKSQVPTRWIDQGAHEAIEIVEVPNRYLAGITEVALKNYVADKTNWRKMLQNDVQEVDLEQAREDIFEEFADLLDDFDADDLDEEIITINYPVTEYPEKIKSLGFDKLPTIEGTLNGIKGQYLILDCGVLNMRKHQGYFITIEA